MICFVSETCSIQVAILHYVSIDNLMLQVKRIFLRKIINSMFSMQLYYILHVIFIK